MWISCDKANENSLSTCGQTVRNNKEVIHSIHVTSTCPKLIMKSMIGFYPFNWVIISLICFCSCVSVFNRFVIFS